MGEEVSFYSFLGEGGGWWYKIIFEILGNTLNFTFHQFSVPILEYFFFVESPTGHVCGASTNHKKIVKQPKRLNLS